MAGLPGVISPSPAATSIHGDVVVVTNTASIGPLFASAHHRWGSYEGAFLDSKAHGYGVQTMPGSSAGQQAIYRGDWKHGKREGSGSLHVGWTGQLYEGGWSNGKAFGYGKLIAGSHRGVESGYKDGVQHGWLISRDVETTRHGGVDSIVLTGGIKKGVLHGYQCKHVGAKFQVVSLCDGKLRGFAIRKLNDQIQSKDFWMGESRVSPPAIRFRPTWLPYKLQFIQFNTFYHGQTHSPNSQATLSTGDIYYGNLKYGVPHGYGRMQIPRSRELADRTLQPAGKYDGGWKEGFACGYGIWTCTDGSSYEGGWRDGKPFGFGLAKVGRDSVPIETFWDDEEMGWQFDSMPALRPFHVDPIRPMPSAIMI
jgi:hypothetical protein